MATAGRGDLINSAWPRKRKRTGSPYLLLSKPADSHFEVWYDWMLGVDGVKFLYSNNPITITQTVNGYSVPSSETSVSGSALSKPSNQQKSGWKT